MSEIYTEAANETLALLEEFGQAITIKRSSGSTIDPVTGATTPGTVADYSVEGILRPYPSQLIDGSVIQHGDRELVIDAGTEPKLTDEPVVTGKQWSIVSIMAVEPAGIPIVYRLQVRG